MKDLKTLFESTLLNEETKVVLQEAWEAAVSANRAELEQEFNDKLQEAVSTLTKDSIAMVEAAVAEELKMVAEELADARTLDVQYAEKLEAFKESYAEKTDELVKELVAESLKEELDELKEDIEFAKKHQFGVKLFEAFRGMYEENFGDTSADIQENYKALVAENEQLKREKIMNNLLESVSGDKRKVVATLLESVATDKLEAKFETLRPIILKEAKEEKQESVAESKEAKGAVILESFSGVNVDTQMDEISKKLARSLRLVK